jgi:putative permease
MNTKIISWFKRKTEDPQAVVLLMVILSVSLIIYSFGSLLAPILIAIVLAYLLEWAVRSLERRKLPRLVAVVIVFVGFIGLSIFLVFGLMPLIWVQLENLAGEVPAIVTKGQLLLQNLTIKYPTYITQQSIQDLTNEIGAALGNLGKFVLSISLASLMNLAAVMVYMILVPLLVFFFLKDKHLISAWVVSYLPKERDMVNHVWEEVNQQIGNYIRGKLLEIVIVGVATYIVFLTMGLNYSLLLGVLVGISVLIPYIGAAVVTIPVAVIAYLQWGWSADLSYLMIAYLAVQAIDGNIIVPLLFSEAVSLHPVAIIGSVLIFGGLWGFWGVFFAIPLATLVKALISAFQDSKFTEEPEAELS